MQECAGERPRMFLVGLRYADLRRNRIEPRAPLSRDLQHLLDMELILKAGGSRARCGFATVAAQKSGVRILRKRNRCARAPRANQEFLALRTYQQRYMLFAKPQRFVQCELADCGGNLLRARWSAPQA